MVRASTVKSTTKKSTKKKAAPKKAAKSTKTTAKKKTTKKTAKKTAAKTTAKKTTKKAAPKKAAAKTKAKATKTAKTTKAAKPKKTAPVKVARAKAARPSSVGRSGKPYFTKDELGEFRSMLEERREGVVQSMKAFSAEVKDHSGLAGGDLGDLAAREVEDTLNMRIQDKNRKLLNEIERALSKFEDGSYGICEGSEEFISKQRLRLRPWTRYSVEYKEYLDEIKKRER